ncbi:MAG: hypothetical protein ACREUF_14940, partial [Solimonas sp.]
MIRVAGLAAIALAWLVLPASAETDEAGSGVVTATVFVAEDVTIEVVVPDRPVQAGKPFPIEVRIASEARGFALVTLHHP